jgi:hypothetical protein
MVSPLVQEKAARKIDLGERLRWVFAPYRPHPSRFWRLAPWRFFSLGCRGFDKKPALDTARTVESETRFNNGTKVPFVLCVSKGSTSRRIHLDA